MGFKVKEQGVIPTWGLRGRTHQTPRPEVQHLLIQAPANYSPTKDVGESEAPSSLIYLRVNPTGQKKPRPAWESASRPPRVVRARASGRCEMRERAAPLPLREPGRPDERAWPGRSAQPDERARPGQERSNGREADRGNGKLTGS
eukprot:115386-Chlamydomonas_euryale.AAC.4